MYAADEFRQLKNDIYWMWIPARITDVSCESGWDMR